MAKIMIMANKQKGFSLIEMLVAAFILAIGILGIVMLQAMALRATRGSSNMSTAARIAGQIIDQAELEGRLSRLNITDANRAETPLLSDLKDFDLKYISVESVQDADPEYFDINGSPVVKDSPDKIFTATTRRVEIPVPSGTSTVRMSDLQVRVEFADTVDIKNEKITRTFNLSRRITHG